MVGSSPTPRSNIPLGEIPHHTARGVKSERTPAGKDDRANLLYCLSRIQESGLTRTRRTASNVDSRHRTRFDKHDRATGRSRRQGMMSDLDAIHRREPKGRLRGKPELHT